MKIVFFDMEFANGKIPGSVYSIGYVQTDHRFKLTEPQTDLLMNPDCEWNAYVRTHILAYPMRVVKEAALFPVYYKRLKRLLCKADLVVGFAVKNDTVALRRACERYGLKPLEFDCLDMERVCKTYQDHPDAHGLSGYVRAYCGEEPKNQHRSDGDAYATMMLLRAICELHGLSPKKIKQEFADQLVSSMTLPEPKPERHRRPKRQIDAKTEQTEANPQTEMAPSAPKKKRRRRRKKKPTQKSESGQQS
jgi:DNA polymerase III epsilon subunit-like protein